MEIPRHSATIVARIQEHMMKIHPDIRLDGVYARNQSAPATYTFLPWYMFSRDMLQRVRDELANESTALTVGVRPMREHPRTQESTIIGLSMDTPDACMWFGVHPDRGTPFRQKNPFLKRRGRQTARKPNFASTQVAATL